MLLLGIDLETGGKFEEGLEKNFITEVGAVLWDTNHGPVKILNKLILPESGLTISPEAEQYTGISQEMVEGYGIPLNHSSMEELYQMGKVCDFFAAHNGTAFDKPLLLQEWMSHYGYNAFWDEKPWIDTMIDVDYPENCMSRNLTYLAGFHILLNSFPHRAVTDVLMMLSILMKYDLEKVCESARSPMTSVVWKEPYPRKFVGGKFNPKYDHEFAEFNRKKDLAKANKFRWQAEESLWRLTTRKCRLPEIDLPYKVEENDATTENNS